MLPIIRGALALNRANNVRKALTGGRGGGGTQNLVSRGTRNQTNAMVVRPKTSLVSRSNITGNFSSGSGSSSLKAKSNDLEGNVKSIKVTVISIDRIIKSNFILEKQAEKDAIKREELLARRQREDDLESKKKPVDLTKNKDRKVRIPGKGLFGGIFDFFINMFLGWASLKLLKYIPTLTKILKPLISAVDFFIDFAGKILNGLVTFIDWGVKLYDFSRTGVSKLFGEAGLKVFDGFINALTTVTNLAILAMMAGINPLNPFGGGGPKGGPQAGPRGRRPGVTTGRGGRGPRMRFPGTGPKVTQSRTPKPRFPGTGPKVTQGRGGSRPGMRIPSIPRVPFGGVVRRFAGPVINTLLAIWDFSDRKASGQTNTQAAVGTGGGILGGIAAAALAATLFPEPASSAAGLLTLGILSAIGYNIGSITADTVTGVNAPKAFAAGGSVGKSKKGRKKNILYTEPFYKPVRTDGESDLFYGEMEYEYNTENGVTKKVPAPEADQQSSKHIKTTISEYGKSQFVGPFFNLYSKSLLGQKPTESDYQSAGEGFNAWVASALNSGNISPEDILSKKDFDLATWSTSSLKDLVNKSTRKLSSSYRTRSYAGGAGPRSRSGDQSGGPGTAEGERDSASGALTSLGSGGGSLKDMSDQDFSDLAYIVSHEAKRKTDDEYGVAAAVLNRVADPRYPNTIMGVGTAPGQFEAVFTGKAYRDEALAKQLKANQGKIVEALRELNGRTDFKAYSSMGEFMGDSDVMFAPDGNFYHYAEQRSKSDPIPGNIPQEWKKLLGPSNQKGFMRDGGGTGFFGGLFGKNETSTEDAKVGDAAQRLLEDFPQITTRGNNAQIYASGLGFWLKKNFIPPAADAHRKGRGDLGDPPQKGGDMEHPDHGGIVASHRGQGHNKGVALDLGAHGYGKGGPYAGDQKFMWPFITRFLKHYGLSKEPVVPQVIHAVGESFSPRKADVLGPDAGHNDHFHIEFHKGGLVPGASGKELTAKVLGQEFVTDVDSAQALEQVYPGLLAATNKASNREGVLKAISEYTSTDSPHLIIHRQMVTNTVLAKAPESGDMSQNSSSFSNMDYFGVLDRLPG